MAILKDIKIMMLKGEKGDQGEGVYDDTEIRGLIEDEAEARAEAIAQLQRDYLEFMYPVGSIYMSVNTTSPAVLFGGTWEKIEGKFLLGSSSSHEIGSTGGVESNSYTPSGTVGNHTLTVNEIPAHNHPMPDLYTNFTIGAGAGTSVRAVTVSDSPETTYNPSNFKLLNNGTTGNKGGGQAHNHGFTGSATTFNNMPPYLTVNVWKRTA